MDILDDMGVSKLSAKVCLKVNYSFKKEPAFTSTDLQSWSWWRAWCNQCSAKLHCIQPHLISQWTQICVELHVFSHIRKLIRR